MVLIWSWLVALGIAPLLLALAPCAAMCALGLCMKENDGKLAATDAGSGARNASTNLEQKGLSLRKSLADRVERAAT